MGKLNDLWNKNKFSIYKSDELSTLKLIENVLDYLKEVGQETDNTKDIVEQFSKSALPNEIKKQINELYENGKLTELINDDLYQNYVDDILNITNDLYQNVKKYFVDINNYSQYKVGDDWKNAIEKALEENDEIFFPDGIYKTSYVKVPSNKVIKGNGNKTIFVPLQDTLFSLTGSAESEILISSDIVDFSDSINLQTINNISPNDYIMIKGQRDSLSYIDSGDNWCLGYATPNSPGAFFGEYAQVKAVNGTNIILFENLIFPNYLSNKLSEVSTIARSCTTVQKIIFTENVIMKDFKVEGDCTYVFSCNFARNCIIENVLYEQIGYIDGIRKFINFKNCFKCIANNCSYIRDNDNLPTDHYYLNMYTIGSSHNCSIINCKGDKATQTIDISYFSNNICSANNTIEGCLITNATQTGIVTHGGTYKTIITNNKVFNSKQGICIRTKNSVITNNIVEGRYSTQQTQYGIALYEGHATDSIIANNNISSFGSGILIIDGDDEGETFKTCNVIISNNTINNCFSGIATRRGTYADPNIILNIMIKNNVIKMHTGTQGISLFEKTSGVTIEGNIFQYSKLTTGTRGIWCSYNCQAIRVYTNVFRNCEMGIFHRGANLDSITRIEIKHKDNIYSYVTTKLYSGSRVVYDEVDKENYLLMKPIFETGDYSVLENIPPNTLFISADNRLCFKDISGFIKAIHIPTT